MSQSDENIIFDLRRDDYSYKGVLFADLDQNAVVKMMKYPFPVLENYQAGLCGIIWTDENGVWNVKFRIKYSSGNKAVFSAEYSKEQAEGINVNETYCLNEIYTIPLINKIWTKNPDGTPQGILKIINDLDMIESSRIIKEQND